PRFGRPTGRAGGGRARTRNARRAGAAGRRRVAACRCRAVVNAGERGEDVFSFVESSAASITSEDRAILAHAESTLAEGTEVLRWWQEKDKTADYADRVDVVREYADSGSNFGFFDSVPIDGGGVRVMGIVQEMFYDRQKLAPGEAIQAQMKE